MTDLGFEVVDVEPARYAAAPHLMFRLRVTESSGERVHAIALRAQIRIDPARRPYSDQEREGLADLFGTPDRYATTLKPFLWTHAATMVQGFTGQTEFELPVACTYDFEVSGTKYLHALTEGSVPVALLFNGTVFTRGTTGFAVQQLPWSLEAGCHLPVATWRALMDRYFPGSGWIRLERDTIDALVRHKSQHGLLTWDQTIAALLPEEAFSP